MAKQTSTPKGRLEEVLDEFTDVHGTVLLGMHKEIRTLKAEIQKNVESQIGAVLTEIRNADSELLKHMDQSRMVAAETEAKTKAQLETYEEGSVLAHSKAVEATRLAEAAIDKLEKAARQASANFEAKAQDAMRTMIGHREEFQSKLSASLAFADQLNNKSLQTLKEVEVREQRLHIFTRRVVIAVGVVVLATLGVWIWLTIRH